jgi:hypothetical protein
MKQRILLLFVVVSLLGSCTTMYKSGQTPDDVYYSPGREVPALVESEKNDSRRYEEDNVSDQYLKMKSSNRNRWSAFDEDFMYWNNPAWNNPYYYNTMRPVYPYGGSSWNLSFNFGYYSGFYPYYSYWNNPFCYPGYYGTPVVIVTNPKAYAPRSSGNLSTYTPKSYSTDPKTGARTYNISGTRSFSNRTGGGSYYTPSSGRSTRTYGTDSYSNPSRSFNNSNSSGTRSNESSSGSSSSGSSRSSGGSAPVRSFPRGGG